MKQLHFKGVAPSEMCRIGIRGFKKVSTCIMLVLAGLFVGCSSDDGNKPEEEKEVYGPESGKVTLKVLSGASQENRIKSLPATRAMLKSASLTYVATIENPTYREEDKKWSATAVAIDNAKKRVYVTWHSDRQASNPAEMWGGAVDAVDITDEDHPNLLNTGVSYDMKFNHVLVHGNYLFLAATSAQNSGAVGRLALSSNGDIPENTETIDRIGFPGVSVNAVSEYDGSLLAVSGYSEGTYGTFAPEVGAVPYYYASEPKKQAGNVITLLNELTDDFGGKFVTKDEAGNTYILYNKGNENATVLKVNDGSKISLDTRLQSSDKYAETYDYNTGKWIMANGTQADHYGKHTLVVLGGYLYAACGSNGLRVYDMQGNLKWSNNTNTIGLCTDGDFLYASTGAGLRIYEINEDDPEPGNHLILAAFEVKTYNENGDGAPTSKEAAETGTAERHSPNFVAVNKGTTDTYIYIAYGQSGVRVYKFTPTQWEADVDPYEGVELDPEFGL